MYPVTRIEEKRGQREHDGTPPVNLEVHRGSKRIQREHEGTPPVNLEVHRGRERIQRNRRVHLRST